jgi:hypothetical protein
VNRPTKKTISQKTSSKNSPSAEAEAAFAEFWTLYPRKVGKIDAEKAWSKACKRVAEPAEIIAALRRFDFPLERQYVPHPAAWLNKGRWMDEPATAPAAGNGRPSLPAGWS